MDLEFNQELHILTDLQDYSFNNLKEKSLSKWNVFIHEISFIESNISITSVDINNEVISKNKKIKINVTVQNNGKTEVINALLVLNIDKLNVGQQQFDLNAGESGKYTFETLMKEMVQHWLNIYK